MKSLLRLSTLFVAAVALVAATGCAKKPLRPNPSQTMMGSGADSLRPGDLSFDQDSLLQERPMGSSIESGDRETLRASTVYFDFDSAAIRPAERSKIQEAANYLRSNPGAQLALEGHCDWRGTTEYNLGLGDRRARSVRDFLTSLGIDAARIQTVSKGDLEAVEGASEAQAQQDRRVEFVLVSR